MLSAVSLSAEPREKKEYTSDWPTTVDVVAVCRMQASRVTNSEKAKLRQSSYNRHVHAHTSMSTISETPGVADTSTCAPAPTLPATGALKLSLAPPAHIACLGPVVVVVVVVAVVEVLAEVVVLVLAVEAELDDEIVAVDMLVELDADVVVLVLNDT